ncbi:DUF58 domain-containing protein [Rhodoferax sp. OV413]|uniref:DUF58 domain-containing protein n=1 Tax=Rhodoferax sp. OV413 TaxID=1855285 RepID=UPI0025E67576|nr:DUF58 domain-containing protein [Rhodoferax sp. OV413]
MAGPGWNPLAAAHRCFQAWFESRLPRHDSCTLTQRNVYILPTAPGWMLALTLLVLLVSSINYQLNLGYLLTFMLAGAALVGMHVCHGNLRGLTMHLIAPSATFAGASVPLDIKISNPGPRSRCGLALAVLRSGQWVWTDVGPQGSAQVQVRFQATTRGWHAIPALTAETRFPLGTFRVWTVWHPASKVLVYPTPEPSPPPLPPGEPGASGQHPAQRHSSGELDGLRAYRRGDPRKQIVWKKAAKSDALVSRDTEEAQPLDLWLDLAPTLQTVRSRQGPLGAAVRELALSRLCAWVLQAESRGLRYGLRLGGQVLPPDSGPAHQQRCLQALALA